MAPGPRNSKALKLVLRPLLGELDALWGSVGLGFFGGAGDVGFFPGIAQKLALMGISDSHPHETLGHFFSNRKAPPECYSCYSGSCGKSTVTGGYGMI